MPRPSPRIERAEPDFDRWLQPKSGGIDQAGEAASGGDRIGTPAGYGWVQAEVQAGAVFSQSAYAASRTWQLLLAALEQPSMHVSLASHWHASMHDTIVAHDPITAE